MKKYLLSKTTTALILFALSTSIINAQSTGYIIRQTTSVVTSAGRTILDPNNNRYTSVSMAAFVFTKCIHANILDISTNNANWYH